MLTEMVMITGLLKNPFSDGYGFTHLFCAVESAGEVQKTNHKMA